MERNSDPQTFTHAKLLAEMPRVSNGKALSATRSLARTRPGKKAKLDALSRAEQDDTSKVRGGRNRLGEIDGEQGNSDGDIPEHGEGQSRKRRKIDRPDAAVETDSEGSARHEGVDGDDGDSEIDSDEAMGESDEGNYEGFAFRGSKSTRRSMDRTLRGGINKEDVDNEDDLGEDAVDLATAWDMNDEEDGQIHKMQRSQAGGILSNKTPQVDDPTISQGDPSSQDDSDVSDDVEEESLFSAEEAEDGDLQKLHRFVQALDTNPGAIPATKKTAQMKLTAADFMSTVTDPAFRQSRKLLANNEKAEPQAYKKGVPGKLDVPLAKRQQDRLNRIAAYDVTKSELNKWQETVKQNRRAEHLSFPLANADASAVANMRELAPLNQTRPLTALETTIRNIMEESGLRTTAGRTEEEQLQAYEELEEKKIPLEEVQARRAELRKVRDFMFREEARARRIKKIKSKAYRRVHRKQRDRAAEEDYAEMLATGQINSEDERERLDKQRAEARMGARHKESRWAKSVRSTGRAAWDAEARDGVLSGAQRDEELRRRIEGKNVLDSDVTDDELSSSESSEESDSEEEDERLDFRLRELEKPAVPTASSKLGQMAFMRKAEAIRKAANDKEIEMIRQDLLQQKAPLEDSEQQSGRVKFGDMANNAQIARKPQLLAREFDAPISGEEFIGLGNDMDVGGREEIMQQSSTGSQAAVSASLRNPWAGQEQEDFESSQPSSNPWKVMQKHHQRREEDSKTSHADLSFNIGRSQPGPGEKLSQPFIASSKATQSLDDATSSSGSDDEPETPDGQILGESTSAKPTRMMFAGDDVVEEEFTREKLAAIEEEDDHVVDNSLPGWGSWTGGGISKKEQARQKKHNADRFLTTVPGIKADKRRDVRLDKVIINEKLIKKNSRYLAPDLPHPFESRQQYERSLRIPLGPEWTTKTTFQDAIKPKVLVKQGVIAPMSLKHMV